MTTGTRSPTAIDVRPWPGEPRVRHLVVRDHTATPTAADVDEWVRRLAPVGGPRPTVRTSALFPQAASAFVAAGFREIDRLVLLERPIHATTPRPSRTASAVRLRRLGRRRFAAAVTIDRRSFEDPWANDERSLRHTMRATPDGRHRIAVLDGRPVGYSVTGRAATNGYLQRLAVDPVARRSGVASTLVDDAVGWLGRRGATTLLVNTGRANEPAIALYHALGFHRRREELVVLELRGDDASESPA